MRIRSRSLLMIALLGSAAMVTPGAPPAAGAISGKVTYTGTPPKMKTIDMAKEPFCARIHAAAPVLTENEVTGPGKALRGVHGYASAETRRSSRRESV